MDILSHAHDERESPQPDQLLDPPARANERDDDDGRGNTKDVNTRRKTDDIDTTNSKESRERHENVQATDSDRRSGSYAALQYVSPLRQNCCVGWARRGTTREDQPEIGIWFSEV